MNHSRNSSSAACVSFANGTGSVLDLSALTTLTVSGTFDTEVSIEALSGGLVDLDDGSSDVGSSSTGAALLALPDMYGELDAVGSLPDFNEAEFAAQLQAQLHNPP